MGVRVGASLRALPSRGDCSPQAWSPAGTDLHTEGSLANWSGVSFRATPILIWEAGVGNAHLVEVGVAGELMQGGDLRLPAKAPEFGLPGVGVKHEVGSAGDAVARVCVLQNSGVRNGFHQP